MLYDPKWEKHVEADLEYQGVSLRGFIAWLEMQNPDEQYCYVDAGHCAVAQYKTFLGHKDNIVTFDQLAIAYGKGRNWLETIVLECPHTFGGALERSLKADR